MEQSTGTTLLRRAREGSREALNDLFERYSARLLAVIRLRMGRGLRSRLDSRDILGASMLKAFRKLDGFAGDDSRTLMAWLARIAENELRDQADFHGRGKRDAGRDVVPSGGLDELAADVRTQSSRVVLDERLSQLERALLQLDEPQREVILLRKLEEMSYVEIGRRLNKSPDACRMLLARAMTALTLKMS
ncbi:MAG: sigma-70 family RNA polymerase sigma factor [bacterium]|nr:sigma-70 family RNA polymerase sigma factor [bacterium]